jgi:hypothetical protein
MAAKKTAKKTKRKTGGKGPGKAMVRREGGGRDGLTLPSGRSVSFVAEGGREELVVRSAQGEMELKITLTKDGPVLSLSGARLEINSTDAVSVNCRAFEVNASEGVRLRTAGDVAIAASGELRAKTGGKIHLDGEMVNLNSGDRTGYPDEQTALATQALVERALAARAAGGANGIEAAHEHDHRH